MQKMAVIVLIGWMVACGGYGGKTNPMSPEEIQIADMARDLEARATDLAAKAPEKEELSVFRQRAAFFYNLSLRKGPNSLEARKAFDDLYYQRAVVDKGVTEESPLYPEWKEIREKYVLEIARRLGYRVSKSL